MEQPDVFITTHVVTAEAAIPEAAIVAHAATVVDATVAPLASVAAEASVALVARSLVFVDYAKGVADVATVAFPDQWDGSRADMTTVDT